jgi:beta-alanine--pyruvate transaminase
MGGVLVRREIHDTIINASPGGVEFFHGYTYSGHPLAAAAGLATLALYRREDLFARAAAMESYWEDALHSLRGTPHVIDVRNLGLVGAIELEPRSQAPGTRAFDVFLECFNRGVLVRQTGDAIALSPPLIVERRHVDQIRDTLGAVLRQVP